MIELSCTRASRNLCNSGLAYQRLVDRDFLSCPGSGPAARQLKPERDGGR